MQCHEAVSLPGQCIINKYPVPFPFYLSGQFF
jgi:hypothetical protein